MKLNYSNSLMLVWQVADFEAKRLEAAFLEPAQWESTLALDRAHAVVGHFIELGLLRSEKLSGVAGDSHARPFSVNSEQNRARNRTVVLRLSVKNQTEI
jgi:hypothetical protein